MSVYDRPCPGALLVAEVNNHYFRCEDVFQIRLFMTGSVPGLCWWLLPTYCQVDEGLNGKNNNLVFPLHSTYQENKNNA